MLHTVMDVFVVLPHYRREKLSQSPSRMITGYGKVRRWTVGKDTFLLHQLSPWTGTNHGCLSCTVDHLHILISPTTTITTTTELSTIHVVVFSLLIQHIIIIFPSYLYLQMYFSFCSCNCHCNYKYLVKFQGPLTRCWWIDGCSQCLVSRDFSRELKGDIMPSELCLKRSLDLSIQKPSHLFLINEF